MSARRAAASRRTPAALGTVELLPSGRYRAFYRKEGTKFPAPHTFATKDDAHTWLASERADRARGTWIDPRLAQDTLREYADAWMLARPDLSPRTRDLYQRALDRWILPQVGTGRGVELGALAVADLTTPLIRKWYAAVYSAARASAESRQQRHSARGAHPARAWARSRDIPVSETGRISPDVLKAWREAGCPVPPREAPASRQLSSDPGRTAVAQAYRVLRTILGTAVIDGVLTANPCQIAGAGIAHHRKRGIATPAQVAALAQHMPAHLSAAVTLAAWSGLRYGELFALARRHVNLDAGTVQVERALINTPSQPLSFGKTKTEGSNRSVHLPGFVCEALREHLAEHVPSDPDALLFSTATGAPLSNARLSVIFRRARVAVGCEDLRWHDLRHTGATLAYRAGASVPDVQARLGHTTMRAAQIYAHAADDSDKLLAANLDAMFSGTANAPRLRAV